MWSGVSEWRHMDVPLDDVAEFPEAVPLTSQRACAWMTCYGHASVWLTGNASGHVMWARLPRGQRWWRKLGGAEETMATLATDSHVPSTKTYFVSCWQRFTCARRITLDRICLISEYRPTMSFCTVVNSNPFCPMNFFITRQNGKSPFRDCLRQKIHYIGRYGPQWDIILFGD